MKPDGQKNYIFFFKIIHVYKLSMNNGSKNVATLININFTKFNYRKDSYFRTLQGQKCLINKFPSKTEQSFNTYCKKSDIEIFRKKLLINNIC